MPALAMSGGASSSVTMAELRTHVTIPHRVGSGDLDLDCIDLFRNGKKCGKQGKRFR